MQSPRCVCGEAEVGISEREEISSRAEPEVKVKKENISRADLAHIHTQGWIWSKGFRTFQLFKSQADKHNDWQLLQCHDFLGSTAVGCREEAPHYEVLNIKLRGCFPRKE